MIGLITVRQMQLARHSYKILQQEIHSVPFNLSQEVTALEGRRSSLKQRSCIKKTEFTAGVIQMLIATINLKDFPLSYTYKVAYNLQQSLFQLTELPAGSRELLEISLKSNSIHFSALRVSFRH